MGYKLYKTTLVTAVCAGTLLAGSLVLLLCVRTKSLRSKPVFPLLVALFVANVTRGLFNYLPAACFAWRHIEDPPQWARRLWIISPISLWHTAFTTAALAVLQCLAIMNPIVYKQQIMCKKYRVYVMVISFVLIAILLVLPEIISETTGGHSYNFDFRSVIINRSYFDKVYDMVRMSVVTPVVLLILSCQATVLVAVLRRKRRQHDRVVETSGEPSEHQRARMRREYQASLGVAAMLVLYCVFALLWYSVMFLPRDKVVLQFCVLWMSYALLGIVMPIFYSVFTKDIHDTVSELLFTVKSCCTGENISAS